MGSPESLRELTVDDLVFLYNESPVGDYFTVDKDGDGVQLHDVLTRKPLVPGAVPEGILETPELAAGIDYLRASKPGRLSVQWVLGPHGSGDDFRSIIQQHSQLFSGQWMGAEMSWSARYMAKDIQPDKVFKQIAGSEFSGRRAFQTEQLLWAHDNQKDIIPCEISVDDHSVLATELKHLWYDIYEPLSHANDITPVVRDAGSRIAERAYQATRQWTIVAQLGNWLMRLDNADRLPDSQFRLPVVIGSWHAGSVQRLQSLGVSAEAYSTADETLDKPEWQRYGQLVVQSLARGHLDMDFLQTPMPGQ